jgi:hypothetical protein
VRKVPFAARHPWQAVSGIIPIVVGRVNWFGWVLGRLIKVSVVQFRHMRRGGLRLFIAIILLTLCAANAAAWPLSFWRTDILVVEVSNRSGYVLSIYRGSLMAAWTANPISQGLVKFYDEPSVVDPKFISILNFIWYSPPGGVLIGLPLWLCSILFGYWGVRQFRHLATLPPGCCQRCGYDLRATPHRCPECGAIPSQKDIISN